MLALKNFFSGTAVLADPGPSGSMITMDITIGTVTDVNKTLFFYTQSTDYDVSFTRNNPVSVQLLDASTLRVQWWNVFGQVVTHSIRWWVMEFTEGVKVQHYYSATQPASPITITAVDTTKSFIIPSWALNTLEWESGLVNTGANFSFASSTSVTMANAGALMAHVSMQVVQWDGAIAQHAIGNINAATPIDVPFSAVNLARAVVFSSNDWTSPLQPVGVNQFTRCYLNSSTAVRLDVDQTEYLQNVAITLIEIPHFKIQRGSVTILNAAYSGVAAITSVDTSKSIPWVSMANRPWAQRDEWWVPNIFGGAHAVLLTFNSATEINLARGRPWSDIDADWQVMEFQPLPPRSGVAAFLDPAIF
jgi:hypothetical protein